MSHWETLVANALVGTDRAPAFPALSDTPLDATLAQVQGLAPPRRLLAAAAIVALWERAGLEPSVADKALPDPAPRDDVPFCSPRASRYLLKLLAESLHDLVPEYLAALARRRKAISPIAMPELFDYALNRPPVRQLIIPVLGAHGRWLASQNPAWAQLFVTPDESALAAQWETASRSERSSLLTQLRAGDPAAARDVITKTWDQEPAEDRATFLSMLADQLSPADEAFLEAALDDRSKRVRAVAADLLARLPNSALAQRMVQRIKPLVQSARSRLDVGLPAQCDAAMERDGIQPKAPAGVSERMWWLAHIVAAVPLSFWTQLTSRTPSDVVKLVGKSDQRASILSGWARTGGRCGDATWCEVLLHQWVENPWIAAENLVPLLEFSQAENLVEGMAQDRLEAWIIDLLKRKRSSDDESNSILFILSHHRRPWSAALTRAFLDRMCNLSAQLSYPVLNGWVACPVELCGDPSVEPEFSGRGGRPPVPTIAAKWRHVLETLRFRREMLEALTQ